MPTFVHLAPERDVKRITRHGIRGAYRRAPSDQGYEELSLAVFCMPILPNFHLTHQWLRELKRRGQRTFVGVYFHLSADEHIWAGRYNLPHQKVRAGEAIKIIMGLPDAEGHEIIVPRNITSKEVRRTRHLPQTVGWRYMPQSHATKPYCPCPYCIPPVSIKSRRLRERLEAVQSRPDEKE